MQCVHFQSVDFALWNAFSGNGTLTANFCNGSMTLFSSASSFLPGKDVTITCSVPGLQVAWISPQFSESVVLSNTFGKTGARFDGAITFILNDVMSSCATATATIANIQEMVQGLNLTCSDGTTFQSAVVIDVVGKLYVVPKVC